MCSVIIFSKMIDEVIVKSGDALGGITNKQTNNDNTFFK